MLEWYREGADYAVIMNDVEKLLIHIQKQLAKSVPSSKRLGKKWSVISLESLLDMHTVIKLGNILTERKLSEEMKKRGYAIGSATWEQLFDQLLLNEIEPHFPEEPFFLVDFPARLSPLCAIQTKKPYLAQRFEFFINGVEIGNGNTENTNAIAVLETFQKEERERLDHKESVHPFDTEFISSLTPLGTSTQTY